VTAKPSKRARRSRGAGRRGSSSAPAPPPGSRSRRRGRRRASPPRSCRSRRRRRATGPSAARARGRRGWWRSPRLVFGLLERERRGELPLEVGVAGEDRRARQLALGVERQQLVRHLAQRLPDARFGAVPGGAAELVEPRRDPLDAAVLLHQVQPVDRHEAAACRRRRRARAPRSPAPPPAAAARGSAAAQAAAAVSATVRRPTNWPMPWSAWTTKSPTRRSRRPERKGPKRGARGRGATARHGAAASCASP
jgi:hypothetical protein